MLEKNTKRIKSIKDLSADCFNQDKSRVNNTKVKNLKDLSSESESINLETSSRTPDFEKGLNNSVDDSINKIFKNLSTEEKKALNKAYNKK